MIDKNQGDDYSKENLYEWKKTHENRIKESYFSIRNEKIEFIKDIQDVFEFIYNFVENVFNGYRLDFITVKDNILEIKENRGKFRKYFGMIFNPLEFDEDSPYPIDCTIRFLENKYSLSFYANRQERGFFFMGGDLQIFVEKEESKNRVWSNVDNESPREILDNLWQEIQIYVKKKTNYLLKIPEIQLHPDSSKSIDNIEGIWREIIKNLQNIKSVSDKNNLLSAYDIIEMHIDRYHQIIKNIERRYGVIISQKKERKVITIIDKDDPNHIKLKLNRKDWIDSFGKYKKPNFYLRDIIKNPPHDNEWHRKNKTMKELLEHFFQPSEDQELNDKKTNESEFCIMKIWSERWDGRTDESAGRNGKNWDEYRIKWTEEGWYIEHIAINGECDKTGEPYLYRNLRQDFISYPNDLPDIMESLWYSVQEENLTKEELQTKLDEISERINLCEMNRARLNP